MLTFSSPLYIDADLVLMLQGRQQQHYGALDHGLRLQDFLSPQHCRSHSIPALLQTEQDEEERLHCLQATG